MVCHEICYYLWYITRPFSCTVICLLSKKVPEIVVWIFNLWTVAIEWQDKIIRQNKAVNPSGCSADSWIRPRSSDECQKDQFWQAAQNYASKHRCKFPPDTLWRKWVKVLLHLLSFLSFLFLNAELQIDHFTIADKRHHFIVYKGVTCSIHICT